jgi:Ca2+-binding RTX toxin-like protein
MARVRAFVGIDMWDVASSIGRAVHADEDLLIIRAGRFDTYYFGEFSYPNDEWKGTITGMQIYRSGELQLHADGFELSTRFAQVGVRPGAADRRALSEDDRIIGSAEDDRLRGYAGDDNILANTGDDLLAGEAGDDVLSGGGGSGRLLGGGGSDRLTGGAGDDQLVGGADEDTFVFTRGSARDTIRDFEDGIDRMAIRSGADGFRDLDITAAGDNVLIEFAGAEIVVLGVAPEDLTRADFLFA